MNQPPDHLRLSRTSSKHIDWNPIVDSIGLTLNQLGADRGKVEAQGKVDRELVQQTFAVFKSEFERAAHLTQRAMTLAIIMIIIGLALAITGGILVFSKPWAGGVVSAAGMGTLFTLMHKALLLARDQAMLQLIPAKYEAALQLCTSPRQYEKILNDMLKETTSLRK